MSASPIPATGVGWNTAIPDNAQPHGNDYNEHRETKLAIAIRNNKEHVAYGATSAGGEHKPGSAMVYFGDFSVSAAGDALPTKRPDASAPWTSGGTALSSADYGRLAYDTDAVFGGIMYHYTATGWVALGYVDLLSAQTIAGVKTFSSSPIVPTPTTDMQASTKKYVDERTANDVVQVVNYQTGAVATGTTQIPYDDTIPQKTEGTEFMTLAVTPKSATNKLKIDVVINLNNSAGGYLESIAALFQDSTANALACTVGIVYGSDEPLQLKFTHYMTAGTTSETTFKVRAGSTASGTLTFNGRDSARKFGGVMASSITITEIRV